MNLRRLSITLLLASAVLTLTACGTRSEQRADQEGDLTEVTLRVALSDNPMTFLREATTAFEGSTYRIEWVEFDSPTSMLEAASTGAVDLVGLLQPPTLLIAQGNSEQVWNRETNPVSAVAAWESPEHPGFSLIVRDQSASSPSALEGGRVAFTRGSIGHYFWSTLEESEAIENVEAVFLPAAEARSAFQSGAVEGLITSYRVALALERRGEGTIFDSSSRLVKYQFVTVASKSALESSAKSTAIDDFLTRMNRAVDMLIADPEPLEKYLSEALDLESDVAEIMARLEVFPRVPLDAKIVDPLKKISKLFASVGVMARDVEPDVVIDRRFDEGVVRNQ
jgi:sulfonate transport system substrate-binding protein